MRAPWLIAAALALAGCQANFNYEQGRQYPCQSDGGSGLYGARDPNCPQGWRCGLEGYCHDTTVAASYQCNSDLNCELGWRCSFNGLCVDSTQDGLVPGGIDASVTVSRLNPLWLDSRPELFAVAQDQILLPDFGFYTEGRWFAAIADGGLIQGLAVVNPDGIWQPVALDAVRLPLTPYNALAQFQGMSFALSDAGFTDVFAFDAGAWQLPWPGIAGARLRIGSYVPTLGTQSSTPNPLLLAYSSSSYALGTFAVFDSCDNSGTPKYAVPPLGLAPVNVGRGCVPALDGGCETLHDMAIENAIDFGSFPGSLVAATNDGLFVALRNESCTTGTQFAFEDGTPDAPVPQWQPVDSPDIPNAFCPGSGAGSPTAYTVRRVHGSSVNQSNSPLIGGLFYDNTLVAELVPKGTDVNTDQNVFVTVMGLGTGAPGGACNGFLSLADAPPYPACPDQSRFVGAELITTIDATYPGPNPPFFTPAAEVRCGIIDVTGTRRVDVYALYYSQFNQQWIVNLEPSAYATASSILTDDLSTMGVSSFIGNYGQIWVTDNSLAETAPLTLDQLPSIVVGSGAGLSMLVGDGGKWEPGGTLGLQLVDAGAWNVLASVRNRPEWLVTTNGLVTDSSFVDRQGQALVVAVLDSTNDALRPPLTAVFTPLGTGGELIVSSSDSLLGADMSGVLNALSRDAGHGSTSAIVPATLSVRSVPLARSPIVSIIETTDLPDGGLFGGYALTSNGLAHFTAFNQQHWESEVVPIPQGNWLALTSDRGRGRLGYDDGRIYSLPSRVSLAGPLDGATVSDYASYCDHTFALASSGLLTLSSSGGALGQWSPVDLGAALVSGAPDLGLTGGRFYTPGSELDLLGRYGTVVQLTASCP